MAHKPQNAANDKRSAYGDPTFDRELNVFRCLFSLKAPVVLETVDRLGLHPGDFFAEPRRDLFNAIITTARRAIDAGEEDVEVSPALVEYTLEAEGKLSEAARGALFASMTGHPYAGTTDNLWVLDNHVKAMRSERMWREIEQTGRALIAIAKIRDRKPVPEAFDRFRSLEDLFKQTGGGGVA